MKLYDSDPSGLVKVSHNGLMSNFMDESANLGGKWHSRLRDSLTNCMTISEYCTKPVHQDHAIFFGNCKGNCMASFEMVW